MTVRLTVVGFAALMLVPSLADAQGLTWHYEPESLVGMPDVTRAPQQHLAQQYDPPSLPPEIMVPERRPVRRGRAATPIIVVPPDPLPPEPTSTAPAPAPTPTVPVESNPLLDGAVWRRTQRCRCAATSVHLRCNDDTLRPDWAGRTCLQNRAGSTSALSDIADKRKAPPKRGSHGSFVVRVRL
jgi:hypothetical protein